MHDYLFERRLALPEIAAQHGIRCEGFLAYENNKTYERYFLMVIKTDRKFTFIRPPLGDIDLKVVLNESFPDRRVYNLIVAAGDAMSRYRSTRICKAFVAMIEDSESQSAWTPRERPIRDWYQHEKRI